MGAFTPQRAVFQATDDLEEIVDSDEEVTEQATLQDDSNSDQLPASSESHIPNDSVNVTVAVDDKEQTIPQAPRDYAPPITLTFDAAETDANAPNAPREVAIQVNAADRLHSVRLSSGNGAMTQRSRVSVKSGRSVGSSSTIRSRPQTALLTQRSRVSNSSRKSQSEATPTAPSPSTVSKPPPKPDLFASKPGPLRPAIPTLQTQSNSLQLLHTIATQPTTPQAQRQTRAAIVTLTPTRPSSEQSHIRPRSAPGSRPVTSFDEQMRSLQILNPQQSQFGRKSMMKKTFYSSEPLVLSHKE